MKQVTATGLAHEFPGTGRLFSRLDLTLSPGEVVAVVGPSGSGKSTLLSILAGWLAPVEGTVTWAGIRRVGWVFQNPHGVPRRTALDHVVLPLLARGRSRAQAEAEGREIMARFGLEDVACRAFRDLSGGEAQRLMLARAVACACDLLLVDEPTAQLDLGTAATVNGVLAHIAQDDTIVVVATHDPHTRDACTRVVDLANDQPGAAPAAHRPGPSPIDFPAPRHAAAPDNPGPPPPPPVVRPVAGESAVRGKMRAVSVLGEAWRNLVTGTSRAALFAAVFVAAVGLVGVVDVRSVGAILNGAETFQAAGAGVHVLKADGMVDGRRCDALSGTGALTDAGAIRLAGPVRVLNLPDSQITVIDATPGIIALLPHIAQPITGTADMTGGVWLSADLAATLGAAPGRAIQTSAGPATVAGVYTWPDDGRARDLGYALIAPVPADGVFSQCWTAAWPPDPHLAGLAYTSLDGASPQAQTTLGQLNTSLGATYDATALLATRQTAHAPWAAALLGAVLGYVAGRVRRLEIASAMHARVPRTALAWQHLVETAAWAGGGALIAAAGLLWAARTGNPDPTWATWLIGARTIAAATLASLLGGTLAVTTTRETHLFRYSKEK